MQDRAALAGEGLRIAPGEAPFWLIALAEARGRHKKTDLLKGLGGRGVPEGPAGPDSRSPDRSRLALWRRRLEPFDLSDRFGIIEPGHEACLLLRDAAGKLGQDVVGNLERG